MFYLYITLQQLFTTLSFRLCLLSVSANFKYILLKTFTIIVLITICEHYFKNDSLCKVAVHACDITGNRYKVMSLFLRVCLNYLNLELLRPCMDGFLMFVLLKPAI